MKNLKKLMIPSIVSFSILATPAWASTDYKSLIRDIVSANNNSTTQSNWLDQQLKPEYAFQQINTPADLEALCSALDGLNAEDIALFSDAINQAVKERAESTGCLVTLQRKIDKHWVNQENWTQTELAQKMNPDATPMSFLSKLFSPSRWFKGTSHPAEIPVNFTIPSIDVSISTAEAPYYFRANLKDNEIAFTFDDGPHPTRTKIILDILDSHSVPALFFELGEHVALYPEVTKMVEDRGSIVGSHTWDHAQLPALDLEKAKEEIKKGREKAEKVLGHSVPFFRFPYGAKSKALGNFLKEEHMPSFFWTMDTLDWKIRDLKKLYASVIQQLNEQKGGIILFHDIHEQTTLVMPLVLAEIYKRKMTAVRFVAHD